MNKMIVSFFAVLITLGQAGGALAFPSQGAETPEAVADAAKDSEKTLVFDVACDARTFSVNGGRSLPDLKRGDGFIVNGKVYEGGTIPAGGTPDAPSSFGPDTPGNIGTWVCRGTMNFNMAEIEAGAAPHTNSTQAYFLGNGDAIFSEGPEGGAVVARAVTGGTGKFAGVVGEVIEEPLGINSTGLFNIRFTFKIKKQARR